LSAAVREPWTAAAESVVVDVRLTPRGGRDAIEGIERRADGRAMLKARVRAAPSAGEANAALCLLVAETLGIAAARVKRIRVAGEPTALVAALRYAVRDG
jgi:uncharacterized protein YggU (UPF0235/DUF167 family)